MTKKWEISFGLIGGSAALLFFGGIAVTFNQMSLSNFRETYQALSLEYIGSVEETFELLRKTTGLFSVTLFLSLIGLCLALYLSLKGKASPAAALIYLVSGVLLLFGTQFIAYPFVFFYLLAAGSSMYRQKIEQRWEADVSK
ncbi:hypothetical protein AX758_07535 [Enterococcus mundtii]|uniref:DUF4064 domain-containing protein n=1 Tax=Enterococcus mundtii TaxID=53346 RepID=UPI0007EEBCA4|nr:DUF4064 domain-containing protein [Enterococcus mundtii]OBS63304.1 hypothetical protein AX758_07535 [Enterococcus mundtii]PTO37981.1 DUF4064 domain-containing protein [Enterococcus mundtii]PTO43928.1 DUF4064 domain-containing protein [Enterococcus mundtii]